MIRIIVAVMLMAIFSGSVNAEIITKDVLYKEGEKEFLGYLAYDNSLEGKRPGVLIVHQWTGLSDYEKERARMLAEMGYVAFALDIYGKGIRPQPPESGQYAGKYKGDRQLYRNRLNLGLEQLKSHDLVDTSKLAAIGYCFGGTGVIELARSGADVDAVVSFHGGLDSPNPQDGAKIKATVLALHGAADPTVSEQDLNAFKKEMETHGVDWQLNIYGHAKHSFTEKAADERNSDAVGYNKHADERSWEAMKMIFEEKFE